jgi:hypothetical protein
MELILVYFILLNGRTTEREGEYMRGNEGHIRNFHLFHFILKENIDMYYWRLCQNSRPLRSGEILHHLMTFQCMSIPLGSHCLCFIGALQER